MSQQKVNSPQELENNIRNSPVLAQPANNEQNDIQTPNFQQISMPEAHRQLSNISIEQVNNQQQKQNINNEEEEYQQQLYEEDQSINQQKMYSKKIDTLKEKQQLLKCSLASHEQEIKELFYNLYKKKKQLLNLVLQKSNQTQFDVDIGIKEQLEQLMDTIKKQENQIQKLQSQIDSMGISGVDNDQDTIKVKKMGQNCQKQIEYASKFASTQYVRDYLQKTHIYKVSYEDVRYEYQVKLRMKRQLQNQKQLYDNKKEVINKQIQKQANKYLQLQAQRDKLLRIIRQNANKASK